MSAVDGHFKHCYIHEGHLCSCGGPSRPPIEVVLYDDEDGTDLLIDGQHNVNFIPSVPPRFATWATRDGSPMRAEIHPTGRHWYVEVQK